MTMSSTSRLIVPAHTLIATILVVTLINIGSVAEALSAGEVMSAVRKQVPDRVNQVAIKITDWATYMKTFNKHYPSLSQMLVRQNLFMTRLYEVFITTLKHYWNLMSYYTTINKFSDLTQEEVDKMTQGDSTNFDEKEFYDDNIVGKILDTQESEAAGLSRRKRGIDDDDDNDIWSSKVPDLSEGKLSLIEKGNDREQARLQTSAKYLKPKVPFDRMQRVVSAASEWLAPSRQRGAQQLIEPKQVIVHKDWRKTGCIGSPRDQGYCDSCYAISSIAFAEWAHCHQKGKFIRFSPQYVVNCASRLNSMEFNGCQRGPIRLVPDFLKEYGLELDERLPYVERTEECPVRESAFEEGWGSIRPVVEQTIRMKNNTNSLDKTLKVRPIIISMLTPRNFLVYGGGIIDDCDNRKSNGHAVLIVGSMTEDGMDYLLVQNSLGDFWGLQGYYKIKKTPGFFHKCVKHLMVPTLKFPDI